MDNILQKIIQCEEEALRMEEESKRQALELLTDARKKAENILEEALVEGEALVEDMLEKARNEALNERQQHERMKMEADERIRTKSREKLESAADFIVGRIVNQQWQW